MKEMHREVKLEKRQTATVKVRKTFKEDIIIIS